MAVIVNAMRALRIDVRPLRLEGGDATLSKRFHEEHTTIRADLDRIRAAADALGASDDVEAMRRVREVHRLLIEDVAPHEAAEEADLYPVLGRLLGGSDPTGPMSRGHAEIAHQIRRLGRLLVEIDDGAPEEVDLAELRGLLYGLYAVLDLHTEQEEESYLSLAEDVDARARGRWTTPAGFLGRR